MRGGSKVAFESVGECWGEEEGDCCEEVEGGGEGLCVFVLARELRLCVTSSRFFDGLRFGSNG